LNRITYVDGVRKLGNELIGHTAYNRSLDLVVASIKDKGLIDNLCPRSLNDWVIRHQEKQHLLISTYK
jgi:hypothetical protein